MTLAAIPLEETTTFSAQKPALQLVSDERRANTSSKHKTSLKPPVCAEDELFENSYAQQADKRVAELQELMKKHSKILSQTRAGTKTMERTLLEVEQLLKGEFLFAYTWDKGWFSKMESNYPMLQVKFQNWESLLAKLEDVLSYVEERQPYGYWYPSKRNGKAERASLADFIAHPMKTGNWMSPFVEIACTDCLTPRMYRDTLGQKVCSVLDEILKDVWFQQDFTTMVHFYHGVVSLKKWHENVSRGATGEDAYHLSSFTAFLDRVRQCNLETHCVGPSFIGPWANKWSVLKSWMHKVHGVKI